jgi:hypothetical protein
MNKRLQHVVTALSPEKPRLRWNWRNRGWWLVLDRRSSHIKEKEHG